MLGVNRGLTCQHQINNAQHISNRNLDKLSYRFSIMHKIELPDAPIGGLKKTWKSQELCSCPFSREQHAQNLLKMIYNRVSIKDVEET